MSPYRQEPNWLDGKATLVNALLYAAGQLREIPTEH